MKTPKRGKRSNWRGNIDMIQIASDLGRFAEKAIAGKEKLDGIRDKPYWTKEDLVYIEDCKKLLKRVSPDHTFEWDKG